MFEVVMFELVVCVVMWLDWCLLLRGGGTKAFLSFLFL